MPTGFQSITDAGIVQIDENYSALSLSQTVVISVRPKFNPVTYYDVIGDNPIVFLGDTGGRYIVGMSRKNMGNGTWRFGFMSSETASVRLYFFDKGPVISGTTGLQVYNAAGELVYDSSNPIMNLVNVVQIAGSDPNTYNFPVDGKKYAASLSFSRSWVDGNDQPHTWWDVMQEGLLVSSTQARTGWVQTGQVGSEDPGAWRRPPGASAPPQILVIDSTNL